MKIVINSGFGGFRLSVRAMHRLIDLGVDTSRTGPDPFYYDHKRRTDPGLVQVVEELGDAADGSHATLRVVEIPDDVEWRIHQHAGWETVHEVHRSWGAEDPHKDL